MNKKTTEIDLTPKIVNVKKVEKILARLSEIPENERPMNKDGGLDIERLNRMIEVTDVIRCIKAEGVESRQHLRKLGFVVASMILTFK